jgi:hypothetical protein
VRIQLAKAVVAEISRDGGEAFAVQPTSVTARELPAQTDA